VQGTVDVLLTLNAPAAGTQFPPGAMQTALYAAVVQTLTANGTPVPGMGVEEIVLGAGAAGTPTPLGFGLVFPTSPPAATRTLAPGESPLPPTAIPSATRSPTPGPSPTSGSTLVILLPVDPSATQTPGPPASNTPPPAPTNTPAPPAATNTPAPPPATSTPPPEWKSECGPDVSQGHCKQTQTAAAGG